MPGNWVYALGMRICCLYRAFHCRTNRQVLTVVIRRSALMHLECGFAARIVHSTVVPVWRERRHDYGKSVPLR